MGGAHPPGGPRKLRWHRGTFIPKVSALQALHPTGIQLSDDAIPSRSHASFPKLELGLGHRPSPPREPPTCSICLERLREPISLDCGHDFCIRCFSTHRIPGCEPPCCPECRKICKQKKGLRSLGERMKLLPQRPLPPALQVRDLISALRDLRLGPRWGISFDPILNCQEGAQSSRLDTLPTWGQSHLGCSGDPSLSHPGDLCREGRAAAIGAYQCLWRPHPQNGGHKPLPEASIGQGHTCLFACCTGRAALRKVLPPGPLAQRFTKPGEGRAGRKMQGGKAEPQAGSGRETSLGMQTGPSDTFSIFRNLVTMAGPGQRGLCLGSDGVPMALLGASGCGVTPSCWEKKGRR